MEKILKEEEEQEIYHMGHGHCVPLNRREIHPNGTLDKKTRWNMTFPSQVMQFISMGGPLDSLPTGLYAGWVSYRSQSYFSSKTVSLAPAWPQSKWIPLSSYIHQRILLWIVNATDQSGDTLILFNIQALRKQANGKIKYQGLSQFEMSSLVHQRPLVVAIQSLEPFLFPTPTSFRHKDHMAIGLYFMIPKHQQAPLSQLSPYHWQLEQETSFLANGDTSVARPMIKKHNNYLQDDPEEEEEEKGHYHLFMGPPSPWLDRQANSELSLLLV